MSAIIEIYTDGSCQGNPGPGGHASIIRSTRADNNEPFEAITSGHDPDTTNNRMELAAVIQALTTVDQHIKTGQLDQDQPVVIHCDSKYIVDAINKSWIPNWQRNGWLTAKDQPVANQDLWAQLIVLNTGLDVRYQWVKAHAGNPLNEECDRIAKEQAEQAAQVAKTNSAPEPHQTQDTNLRATATTAQEGQNPAFKVSPLQAAAIAVQEALGPAFGVSPRQRSVDVETPLRYPDQANIIVYITQSRQDPSNFVVSDWGHPTCLKVLGYRNLADTTFQRAAMENCKNLQLELREQSPDPLIATTVSDLAQLPDAVIRVAQAMAQITATLQLASKY